MDSALYLLILWFRLFMFSYLTSFFSLRMLPGEVNLSLHRKDLKSRDLRIRFQQGNLYLPSVTVCVVKLKNIMKMFFNMDDCFYIFGELMEKNKKKRKKEAVCDVCC